MTMVVVDRRLYLDSHGKCVEEGDPSAATLWHPVGAVVHSSEADRVGYRPKGEAEKPPSRVPESHKSRKPKSKK